MYFTRIIPVNSAVNNILILRILSPQIENISIYLYKIIYKMIENILIGIIIVICFITGIYTLVALGYHFWNFIKKLFKKLFKK
jgi:hypothetical protein